MIEKVRTSIWVISMPDSLERRAQFERSVTSSDLSWSFFDAYRETAPGLQYDPEITKKFFGRELHAGEIGCYSSHFALWQQLLEDTSSDQYIIIEDDVVCDWNMVKQVSNHNLTKDGIEYIRFIHIIPSKYRVIMRNYIRPRTFLLQLFGSPLGTQAYVINKQGAKKFVDKLSIVKRPIDVAMDRYWENGVRNLCFFPFFVFEKHIPSTISKSRGRNKAKINDRIMRLFHYYKSWPIELLQEVAWRIRARR